MGSWDLGTISGIRIRIHWTFLILPVWIYFSSILAGSGMAAALATLIFVLAIFGCVLLHELGHALAARQFGIPTRDITLLPIGGVAALERMPRNPWQELWIAVAGPLVNVVIATLLFVGLALLPLASTSAFAVFFWRLALANVVLVVFNLLPAFPMDGGRVLRSILAMVMDWHAATRIAATVGKISAIGLGLLGLSSGNLMLVLVAAFVFFAAQSELSMAVQMSPDHSAGPSDFGKAFSDQPFQGFPDQRAFEHRSGEQTFSEGTFGESPSAEQAPACSVPASLSANSVVAWLANRRADNCQVVDSGRPIGTITKTQLLSALSRGFGNMPVGQLLN